MLVIDSPTESVAAAAKPPPMARGEQLVLVGLFLVALCLRILYALHFRIDSDEPQHLHVLWGWCQGQLPYRDFFDNHMPLFQAAYAPIFRAFGERADIIIPMRLALLPIYAGTIWAAAGIARLLVSNRAAWWTAAIVALHPPFFFDSTEFRPDDLWALLWMLTLLVLVFGPFTVRRGFAAGLLLGTTFSVSMKTSLMLGAIALAGLGVLLVARMTGQKTEKPRFPWASAVSMLAGILVMPALVVLFFAAHGAAGDLYDCVIAHNVSVGAKNQSHLAKHLIRFVLGSGIAFGAALYGLRFFANRAVALRAVFIFFAAVLYYVLLTSFWPILTAEDYIPFFPAICAVAVPFMFVVLQRAPWPTSQWLVPTAVAAGEIVCLTYFGSPLRDDTRDKIGMVADVLRLTDRSDYVLDSKGETIYRRRPIFPVLEGLTMRKMRRGEIENDIPERLIETRTPIVTFHRMPGTSLPFLSANYVRIAFRLAVLGKMLHLPRPTTDGSAVPPVSFDLAIGGRYRMITPTGNVTGRLNGQPFAGEATLEPGHYEFQPDGGRGRFALIWAQAIERGYSPFAEIKGEYRTEQD